MADFQCPGFLPVLAASCSPSVWVLSQPAAWTLPSCPPCMCPPRWRLLTQTAQHGVLGQKDALALTLLGKLGRSAPELAGPKS